MNVSPRCYCGGNHGFVCFDMDGSTYNWFCSKLCRQVWRVTRGACPYGEVVMVPTDRVMADHEMCKAAAPGGQ
jgi:hypothetical protein